MLLGSKQWSKKHPEMFVFHKLMKALALQKLSAFSYYFLFITYTGA